MKSIISANQSITSNSPQLEILKHHFPNCFDKHGAFMPHKLQEIVEASGVALSREGYSLNWLGKSYARLLANENVRTLLKANLAHNHLPENVGSNNMLIKGDNLEVLKHLMGAYAGKVKMIYIDPPYNTGSDGFVYADDRKFTVEQLSHLAGIEADEAQRILEFTSSGSNSHSAWLTFMYPRLYLAKQLLRDDGVIFISIDDNEQAQLKLLMDEVFGEENFVGTISWNNVTDNNPTNIATEHETIHVYSKSKNNIESVWKSKVSIAKDLLISIGDDLVSKNKNLVNLQTAYTSWFKEHKSQLGTLDRYKYIDEGGVYTGSQSVHNPGKDGYRYDIIHPITNKPCKQPLMGYRFPEKTMREMVESGKVLFGDDENKIIELKVYAKDYVEKLSSVIELDGRIGAYSIRDLFPKSKTLFTNPKPVQLIAQLLSFLSYERDLILDFFAGSGTTAHAVMQFNAEDGGNRQFICVQIDEPTYTIDEKTGVKKGKKGSEEAFKAGYKTIYDITAERIKRAAAKIKEAHPEAQCDFGFKQFETIPVFEGYLDEPDELTPELELFNANQLSVAERHSLMLTWQAHDGIALNTALTPLDLAGYPAYQGGRLVYFIEPDLSLDAIVALLERLDNLDDKAFVPSHLVVFGYLLNSKTQREMTEAVKQYNNRKGIELTLDVRF